MTNDAFVKIYQDNKLKLYSYVLYKVKSETVAEDIVSDSFIKLLKSAEKKPEILQYVVPWLFRVASNKIIDHFRSSYHKKIVSESEASGGHPSGDENVEKEVFIEEYESTLEVLVKKEEQAQVISALDELAQNDREIVELRLFQELPFKELAVILESTEGAVKMKYGRAIKKLKDICEKDNDKVISSEIEEK